MGGAFGGAAPLFYSDLLTPTCLTSKLSALAQRIVLEWNIRLVVYSEAPFHLSFCFVLCALIQSLSLIESMRCFICPQTTRAHWTGNKLTVRWKLVPISFRNGVRTLFSPWAATSHSPAPQDKKILTIMLTPTALEFIISVIIS